MRVAKTPGGGIGTANVRVAAMIAVGRILAVAPVRKGAFAVRKGPRVPKADFAAPWAEGLGRAATMIAADRAARAATAGLSAKPCPI